MRYILVGLMVIIPLFSSCSLYTVGSDKSYTENLLKFSEEGTFVFSVVFKKRTIMKPLSQHLSSDECMKKIELISSDISRFEDLGIVGCCCSEKFPLTNGKFHYFHQCIKTRKVVNLEKLTTSRVLE